MARSLPSNAYFEFEAQPANSVPYTFIPETHRKKRIPHLKYLQEYNLGYNCQSNRAKINLKTGATKYGE